MKKLILVFSIFFVLLGCDGPAQCRWHLMVVDKWEQDGMYIIMLKHYSTGKSFKYQSDSLEYFKSKLGHIVEYNPNTSVLEFPKQDSTSER